MIDLARLVRRAVGQLRCFRHDERGSMAMMMGLAAVPIIFSVGAGIDYGTANAAKSKLDAVADTAATVTDGSTGRAAVVNYTATKNNMFMGLFDIPTMTITGQSTAAAGLSTYIDFYLLLDNTPSMGVGATTADINKMVTNTSDQYAFACHDLNNPNNYYNLVKRLGVMMRIDVLKSATQSLMNNATTIETLPQSIPHGSLPP